MFKYLFNSQDTAHRVVIFSNIKKDGNILTRFLKRPIVWYIFSGFIIVLFTPILINSIALYKIEGSFLNIDIPFFTSSVSQENQWVGFFASYSGSIIGGILSGALTLVGVSLTIKQGRIEKMIESYPRKRQAIKELESILDKLEKEFDIMFKAEWNNLDGKIDHVFTQILAQEKEIKKNASEINGIAFLAVLDLVDQAEEGLNDFRKEHGLHTEEELKSIFNNVKWFWFGYYNSTKKENNKYKDDMRKIIKKSF